MSEPYQSYEWVKQPKHYDDQNNWGFQCIDLIEKTTFNVGAAIKHLWRCGQKPGSEASLDISKALWYVDREIAAWKQGRPRWYRRIHFEPLNYHTINQTNPIWHLCQYCDVEMMTEDHHPLYSLLIAKHNITAAHLAANEKSIDIR